MDYSKSEDARSPLYLKLDGRAFQNGIYIHTVTSALSKLQYILDRSYLALAGRKKLSLSDRAQYRLVAQEFKPGSFITLMDIVIATSPITIPLITQIGPENIWKYTKTTFEFLKLIFSLSKDRDSKEKPSISIEGDGSSVIVNQGEQNWTFNAPVILLGEQVLPSYRGLSDLIRSKEVNTIQIGSNELNPEIQLGHSEINLFNAPTEILKDSITIECEIVSFNKKTGHGKLEVLSKQAIPKGGYNFTVAKNKSRDLIQSMLEAKVAVVCLREISFDPFAPQITKIVNLHLLSAKPL